VIAMPAIARLKEPSNELRPTRERGEALPPPLFPEDSAIPQLAVRLGLEMLSLPRDFVRSLSKPCETQLVTADPVVSVISLWIRRHVCGLAASTSNVEGRPTRTAEQAKTHFAKSPARSSISCSRGGPEITARLVNSLRASAPREAAAVDWSRFNAAAQESS